MRIGMILDVPFPPDIRVEKEAKSLHKAGHSVHIFCPQFASNPEVERKTHYTVVRFDTDQYRILKQCTRDFKKITFLDPVWKKGLEWFVTNFEINIIHVHDLPLVKTAYIVAKKFGIPIIADYHENFPAHIEAVSNSKLSLKRRFYHSYKRWVKYEEDISKKVNKIIVVVDEYKQHLIEEHKIAPDKIIIVQNTIDPDLFLFSKDDKKNLTSASEFILSYIGSYGSHRGLDVAIQAMPEILSNIPVAKFVIIGRGKNKKDLEILAQKHKVENSVQFIEWMDYKDLSAQFRKAAVGVIPHRASEHTDNTIPNKLFEYMYFKVPVIVSDRPPLKRIVEETKAGKVFKTGDSVDFARKVCEIYRNPDHYGEMGNKAVVEKYNWNVDEKRLVELYKSFE